MRTSMAVIIGVSWIIFWLYWIVLALGSKRSAKPTIDIKRFMGIRIALFALAAALVLGLNRVPDSFKNRYFATNNKAVLGLGLLMFVLGMFLAVWARVYLGKNWGMPMTQKESPELVTSGPYHYIRHPIYTGILLMALGSALDVNVYWLVIFIAAAVFFIYSAVVEERLMLKQFPKVYPAYKSRTKMLVPFIF